MHLTLEQRNHFDENGYLFFPAVFSQKEVENLVRVVPDLYNDLRELKDMPLNSNCFK